MDTARALGIESLDGENRLEVRNEAAEESSEIILSGAVGKSWWDDSGITEQEVRDAFQSVPRGRKITLRINSEGGSVKEGLGIYDAIRARSADVTAVISGYALSIASVFPLAAGKVISPKSAIWMIHQAWSWASGNQRDFQQQVNMLKENDEMLAEIYAQHTGKSIEECRAAMEAETWVRGSQAVDYGLADETDDTAPAESAAAKFVPIHAAFLERCKNCAPEILNALTGRPPAPNNSASIRHGNTTTNHESTDHTMNKKLIVALLKTHGITASETETEDQLNAKLATIPVAASAGARACEGAAAGAAQPAAAAGNVATREEMLALQSRLDKSERRRVEDRVSQFVISNQITKEELPIFINAALSDEEGTLKILEARQVANPGGDQAGAFIYDREPTAAISKSGVHGTKVIPELENLFTTHKDADARYEAFKAEWPRLLTAAFRKDNGSIQNSNTFSATVTTNFLIAGAIQKLSGRFAAANLFARDAEQDPYKPLALGIRKFNTTATDGTQVQTNATDFEGLGAGGDSIIDAITITPAQYTSGGHITNAQLNSGFRVADIIEKKLVDLAAKITQVITAPITVANFTTNAALISAPAAFSFSDLATLQGQLKKTSVKNLILDGEYIARIANTPGFFQMSGTVAGTGGAGKAAWNAFGWDNIALNTDWSGAGANVRGLACGQDAIGIITGLPLNPPEGIPGNIVQTGVAQLTDVNIGVATYAWFSPSARTFFFTFDIICGASLVDELEGVLVKSA